MAMSAALSLPAGPPVREPRLDARPKGAGDQVGAEGGAAQRALETSPPQLWPEPEETPLTDQLDVLRGQEAGTCAHAKIGSPQV